MSRATIIADIADTSLFTHLLKRLEKELEVLPDKPDETPWHTLACLWSTAAGEPVTPSGLVNMRLRSLDTKESSRLEELIEHRLSGAPLAHLTGRQDFMGIVLLASDAALVPRKETELLGFAAVEKAAVSSAEQPLIIDICTGAGNLALGIATHVPNARVFGSDLSPEAVELARANARFLGREDVEFRCGDLVAPFNEFQEAVDVLVCNPPYIPSGRVDALPTEISQHEPRLAFDGGPFGINLLHRVISQAPALLKEGGWLLFEVGLGQGEYMTKLIQRAPHFLRVESISDSDGQVRVVAALKRSSDGVING